MDKIEQDPMQPYDMDALREHVRAEMARQGISSQKLADLTILERHHRQLSEYFDGSRL